MESTKTYGKQRREGALHVARLKQETFLAVLGRDTLVRKQGGGEIERTNRSKAIIRQRPGGVRVEPASSMELLIKPLGDLVLPKSQAPIQGYHCDQRKGGI